MSTGQLIQWAIYLCPGPLGSYSPSFPSCSGFPKLCLMLGTVIYICSHLLMDDVSLICKLGYSLRVQYNIITKVKIISLALFSRFCWFLYQVPGLFRLWFLIIQAVSGVGPISRHGTQVESVVDWPQKFCSKFNPARLADRTNCKLKVLWLVWCLTPLLIYLPSYRRQSFQALCSPLLGVSTVVTLADYGYFFFTRLIVNMNSKMLIFSTVQIAS